MASVRDSPCLSGNLPRQKMLGIVISDAPCHLCPLDVTRAFYVNVYSCIFGSQADGVPMVIMSGQSPARLPKSPAPANWFGVVDLRLPVLVRNCLRGRSFEGATNDFDSTPGKDPHRPSDLALGTTPSKVKGRLIKRLPSVTLSVSLFSFQLFVSRLIQRKSLR
jgi:hypothetical protein